MVKIPRFDLENYERGTMARRKKVVTTEEITAMASDESVSEIRAFISKLEMQDKQYAKAMQLLIEATGLVILSKQALLKLPDDLQGNIYQEIEELKPLINDWLNGGIKEFVTWNDETNSAVN